MDTNRRVQVLSQLSGLIVGTSGDGKISVSLQNCSVSNIDLCKEFAQARKATSRPRVPHPHLKSAWILVDDDLEKDPRYLKRNVACTQEAKDFTTAIRLLFKLATDAGNIGIRSHEEDAGWSNAAVTAYVAYRFDGSEWKNIPEKELQKIRSLAI